MRILIIGAGAVGSLLGARLALAGHAVTLAGRPRLAQAVRAGGLTLVEPMGRRRVTEITAAGSVAEALKPGASFDLALVTVKAYDTAGLIGELSATGRSLPPLLTLQNGVGNEEALAQAFGAGHVLSGAIDTPVSAPEPGQVVVHRATYKIGLAPVEAPGAATGPEANATLRGAALALAGAGFRTSLLPGHRGLKWTKLLMNMLANATCAILNWTPAQVMADRGSARLEARAWGEALAVMAGLGVRPVALGGYPFPVLLPVARRLPPGWLARALRGFVSGGRGDKMPSLQIALSSGKPSEVNWLNGAVADAARRLGRPAPVNTLLTELLTALSHDPARRDEYRNRPERLLARLG